MTIVSTQPVPSSGALLVSSGFRKLPPPLIIVGMHRSGTSLVAGMLSLMGVFLDPALTQALAEQAGRGPEEGLRISGYGEAEVFRLLNEYLLADANATWDHVTPFLQARDQPVFAARNLFLMKLATYGSLASGYLKRLPASFAGVWGWKDPRNSLTLPYWLRLFPEARILHVRRNPEDIANSLMRRAVRKAPIPPPRDTFAAQLNFLRAHPELAPRMLRRRFGISSRLHSDTTRLLDRDYCLELSRQYTEECLKYRTHGVSYFEVAYEDILTDPYFWSCEMARFTGISPSEAGLEQAARFVLKNLTESGGPSSLRHTLVREAEPSPAH